MVETSIMEAVHEAHKTRKVIFAGLGYACRYIHGVLQVSGVLLYTIKVGVAMYLYLDAGQTLLRSTIIHGGYILQVTRSH